MPPRLPELEPVTAHAMIWRAYDRSVKADLFSTALVASDGTFLIDPIPLDTTALKQSQASKPLRGIIVTNQNHWRGSTQLSKQLSVPIFAHPAAATPETKGQFSPLKDGELGKSELEAINIGGAGSGEIALFSDADQGIVVVGDALINFEPYGFTLLPPKYCTDQKKMRNSLVGLLDYHFERMFFGHGLPILSNARGRLEGLLNVG